MCNKKFSRGVFVVMCMCLESELLLLSSSSKRGKGKISISLKVTRFYFVKQQTTQINNKINWTLICQNVTSVIVCVCVCVNVNICFDFFFFKSHAKEISWSINFNCVFHVKGIFRCICAQFSSIYIPFFFLAVKLCF